MKKGVIAKKGAIAKKGSIAKKGMINMKDKYLFFFVQKQSYLFMLDSSALYQFCYFINHFRQIICDYY